MKTTPSHRVCAIAPTPSPSTTRVTAPLAVLAATFAAALLGAAGGCTTLAPVVEQAPAANARLEASVKGALIEAIGVDGAAVGVTVADDRITLDGFVADEAQRERALAAARAGAAGEATVVDELRSRR